MKIARANQRPNQTKEQTKLIAQGIEKGIAQYKKQQKNKAREADKHRKHELKQKQALESELPAIENKPAIIFLSPRLLLGLTWSGILVYTVIQQSS
ncbi:MAG: DUF2956 family protein [Methylococcaceae bacterium]|nr:DUF2956 family protein [Methylococcaceae bacterium]